MRHEETTPPTAENESADAYVPSDPLTDHAYDGIQEFDNPTPGWWTWLFIGSIIFGVCYFILVTLSGDGLGPRGSYARKQAVRAVQEFERTGTLEPTPQQLVKIMDNPTLLAMGQAVYAGRCVACHGKSGEGMTGPNLTDDHYLNVANLADVLDVVTNGRKNNSMPANKGILSDNDIILVSGYAASLRGKNLGGPRGAEGEVIPAFAR